jgi:hypothetical protein
MATELQTRYELKEEAVKFKETAAETHERDNKVVLCIKAAFKNI